MDIFPAELYLHIQVTYLLFLSNLVFIMVADERLGILFGTDNSGKNQTAVRFCGTLVGSVLFQNTKSNEAY